MDWSTGRRRNRPRARMARAALVETVERGPIPAVHGIVWWQVTDLVQWIWDEFSVTVSKQTLSRELRALGCRKLFAGPKRRAQDPEAIEAFQEMLLRRVG